jgi:prefoldin subunit 5
MPGFATPYDPWGAAEMTPKRELDFLKAEAQQIRDELAAVEQRIQELEKEKK